jgi:hypothetical protein
MSFRETPQPALLQGSLGPATVTILGAAGLRLTGLTSFHLDEGPQFAWLNIYRTMAAGRQLEITRERDPARITVTGNEVEVHWAACEEVAAELSARYRIVESASAVDVTFRVNAQASFETLELFIANYFTPFYTPRYAVMDTRTHPEGTVWYEKRWYAEGENESWARDDEAEAVFGDGRWQTGYPLNWWRGPHYALPLMIQEHRYGHAVLLMARRQECIGISGFNAYHNAQYFHLHGQDVTAGETIECTVRMVLLTEWEDLPSEALVRYQQWMEESNE